MPDDVVVVGAGQAAAEFAWSLRRGGFDGRITVFGGEAHVPYERPPLSKRALIENEDSVERLLLRGADTYAAERIDIRTDCVVEDLDLPGREIVFAGGGAAKFDVCVLATGASPRMPKLPGVDLDGVHALRTFEDARALHQRLSPDARLAVVGGGYLGLEVAAAARMLGAEVTVIENAPRLMQRSASESIAAALEARHRTEGVRFLLGDGVAGIHGEGGKVTGVATTSGKRFGVDVVLIAIGAAPEMGLAERAGLTCANGILTTSECRTSNEAVYAIGDCANQFHPRYARPLRPESVQSAIYHARCAAASILGKPSPKAKFPTFWSNQYDLKIQLAGALTPGIPATDLVDGELGGEFSVRRYQEGRLVAVECVNSPVPFIRAQADLAKSAEERRETKVCDA